MANSENYSVECGDCGTAIDEPRDKHPSQREPCPQCGSIARVHSVTLTGTVTARSSVSGQIVSVGTLAETETLQPITPAQKTPPSDISLPTEVYTEKVDLRLTVLRPTDGQHPVEIRLASDFDMAGDHSYLVGEIDGIFLDLLVWLSDLIKERWGEA